MMTKQEPLLPEVVAAKVIPNEEHPEQRATFEFALRELPWAAEFADYLAHGFTWRETAWIVWSSQPKKERVPNTKGAFADLIGVNRKATSEYGKNPKLNVAILAFRRHVLVDAVPAVFDALVTSASNPNYKHAPDRKLHLEMTGEYIPRSQMNLGVNQGEAVDFDAVLDGMPYETLMALTLYFKFNGDGPRLTTLIQAELVTQNLLPEVGDDHE